MCGALPLRSLTAGDSGSGAGAVSVTATLLPLLPIAVGLWTDATEGTVLATVDDGGGALPLVAPAGTGSRLATLELNAPEAETLTVVVAASTTWLASGLLLTDGQHPSSWVPGQSTPCQVARL